MADHYLDFFVFVDESTFQTHSNPRSKGTCVNHRDEDNKIEYEEPFYAARPKHPLKLHVWGGISRRGPTDLLVFKGIMDRQFYTREIMPMYNKSIERLYPHGDSMMWADNDPKHTSNIAKEYMKLVSPI